MQAATTKTYVARQGSNLPWQASIGMADFSQPEQIGPFFAGFQKDLYKDQKAAGSTDQPPNQPLIRAEP